MDDLFAKLEFMNEEPNKERIELFKKIVTRPGTLEPKFKIIMTSNPSPPSVGDEFEEVTGIREGEFFGGLREKFMTQFAINAQIPLKYLTTTDNVDSAYPKYILNLQNRMMTVIPGMTAYRLSGMSAKDFVNRRMTVTRSKSKRRCAISKLNNKIITLAKRSHHYSDIKTVNDLDGMSRNGKLILLRMLKQNPIYGVML